VSPTGRPFFFFGAGGAAGEAEYGIIGLEQNNEMLWLEWMYHV
jgi:hypothetical protein